MKVTADECVSGVNARRSTSANAERKDEKEESSGDDDAMCFGWTKCANEPSVVKMIAEIFRYCGRQRYGKVNAERIRTTAERGTKCVEVEV